MPKTMTRQEAIEEVHRINQILTEANLACDTSPQQIEREARLMQSFASKFERQQQSDHPDNHP